MTTVPSLKNSLTHWFGFPKLERAFAPRRTRASVNEVTKRLEHIQPQRPSSYDLEALYKKVVESWERHASIAPLHPRDLRRLPWVLFYSPQSDTHWQQDLPKGWLGDVPEIVRQYNRWLSANHRPRTALSLLHEFLRVYPVELKTFEDLRWLLKNAIEDSSSPPPSLLKWKQRCLEFGLLTENGSLSFVRNLILNTDDLEESLTKAGLDAGLAGCGFLESGIRKYLPELSRLLVQGDLDAVQIDRALRILEYRGKLRFEERPVRMEIAFELLRPFINLHPDTEVKELLKLFFLRHFGDPRLPSGRHKWSGVGEPVRRVVARWLVKETLDEFFRLIKETALDRHWRDRYAFWLDYFREELISDAWFVLGSRASRLLKRLSKQSEIKTGVLRGAKGDQSVLLMQMPGVTIAEWSHEGSCRFWLDGNQDAPKLYQGRAYSGFELRRGADFSQRHDRSYSGEWQYLVERWLRENTGASLEREEHNFKQFQTTPKFTKQQQIPWRKRQVRWRR